MSGLLSQALSNAKDAEAHVKSLAGLPPAAQAIQKDSAAIIAEIVTEVGSVQSSVHSFTETAIGQLNTAEKEVAHPDSLAAVKALMLQVQKEAAGLQASVDGVTAKIAANIEHVFGYSNQLAAIELQLNAEKRTLQGGLDAARREESKARTTYHWVLGFSWLGGVLGVAAALTAYELWESRVKDKERGMSATSAQITALTRMVATIKQLEADFGDVSNKVLSVKNGIDFLASDLGQVISDVEKTNVTPAVIALYIQGAKKEVQTVASDAS